MHRLTGATASIPYIYKSARDGRHYTGILKLRCTRRAHRSAHFFCVAGPVSVLFAAGFFLTAGAPLEELPAASL